MQSLMFRGRVGGVQNFEVESVKSVKGFLLMIKVSIIIPAYNVDQYIERCVKSAIHQTLKEIEVIVVNDGSTDNTQDVIERLALEDSRNSHH